MYNPVYSRVAQTEIKSFTCEPRLVQRVIVRPLPTRWLTFTNRSRQISTLAVVEMHNQTTVSCNENPARYCFKANVPTSKQIQLICKRML